MATDSPVLLRWTGSKLATRDQVMAKLPKHCEWLCEPFCGTACVGLEMLRLGRCENLRLSDVNAHLINLLVQVRDRHTLVSAMVAREAARYDTRGADLESIYYEWVAELNAETGAVYARTVRSAALLLLINRTCFNALYRENARGQFNVAWGKRESVDVSAIQDGIAFTAKTMGNDRVSIYHHNYAQLNLDPGDVVYVDSPYIGTFGAYNAVKWNSEQHEALASKLRAWADEDEVQVFASNSDVPETRTLYQGSIFHEIAGRSVVSCKSESRGARRELLIEVRP